jgi:hypothetical protein
MAAALLFAIPTSAQTPATQPEPAPPPAAQPQPAPAPVQAAPQPAAPQPQPAPVAPLAGPPPLPQPVAPPPLPPPPPAPTFFIEQGGQPVGPLTLQDVQQRIQQGTIKGETLVWKQGAPTWVPARDVDELKNIIAAIPPPVPTSEQYRRLLVGTWQTQAATTFGPTTDTTITFSTDGSYAGVQTQSFQGFSLPQPFQGRWNVQEIAQGRFTLTLTPEGAFGVGAAPVNAVLRVVDNNTLFNETERTQARRVR